MDRCFNTRIFEHKRDLKPINLVVKQYNYPRFKSDACNVKSTGVQMPFCAVLFFSCFF